LQSDAIGNEVFNCLLVNVLTSRGHVSTWCHDSRMQYYCFFCVNVLVKGFLTICFMQQERKQLTSLLRSYCTVWTCRRKCARSS